MKDPAIITLTTDFGLKDPYVGIMKGVILTINPEARIVDISHQIKTGDITHAAGLIQEAFSFFPKNTVHVAVIDPGVGSSRRPIIIKTQNHSFVGPDNGLFWPIISAHQQIEIIHLMEKRYFLPHVSHTFHGRDIFAPVAAHLSHGADPLKMGKIITDPVSLRLPILKKNEKTLCGQIVRVDNFGNLITNIHHEDLAQFSGTGKTVIKVGTLTIENVRETYAEVKKDEALALIGSSGYLEIAVNLGRASERLGIDSKELTGVKVEVGKTDSYS
jgi:S-adenosylmethionine hydrolase